MTLTGGVVGLVFHSVSHTVGLPATETVMAVDGVSSCWIPGSASASMHLR